MLEYLLYFLLILNLLTIFFFNRKKIRKYFLNPEIKSVDIEKLGKSFFPISIDAKLKAPNNDMITNTFFVPDSWKVVGMTSDYEAWILSVLSKKSKNIFEFGTCSGKTTMLFALNSPSDAKIYTITLDPKYIEKQIKKETGDNNIATRNAISESKYNNFMFSKNSILKKKIKVIFNDSKKLNIKKFHNYFDLIFIDGGHSYSCIKNDTEKSMKMIKKNGYILWHDYSLGKKSHKDVYRYLNEIKNNYEIFHIKNTSLCFYQKL